MTFSVWILLITRKKFHDYIETEYHFRSRSTAIDASKDNLIEIIKHDYLSQVMSHNLLKFHVQKIIIRDT